MRLDFVLQHKLECRAGNFVFIHDKDTPLIDSFGRFNSDLHPNIPGTFDADTARADKRGVSNFRSVRPAMPQPAAAP
jgi:hypothetical protein